ncbi:hypothetical protein [Streptomyces sp. NPDC059072]|uniref:hypothetical protein n=1 Tax=unclassified Streptomyces TaxID=2593676 RepID=UPI0036C48D3B
MSEREREPRSDEDARRAADEAAAGPPGGTGTDDAGAGGHTAKQQRTGTGREEQIRPYSEGADDER